MLRRFMFVLAVLAVFGFAAAQIDVSPTASTGEEVIAKDAAAADVSQTVVLELPAATALHLTAGTITFDLGYLDGEYWADRAITGENPAADDYGAPIAAFAPQYACVYVSGGDVTRGLGEDTGEFWGQTQVVPGGIAYQTQDTWDKIRLVYHGNGKSGNVPDDERVVTYPPIRIGTDGKLVDGSKDYFVCYQSFVIQLFSNYENFRLQVSRNDDTDQGIKHLYVQGNTCAEFGDETGLYALPNNTTGLNLLPRSLTTGPTGSRTSGDCNENSSWMDVLGVLAVKVNADLYGTSTANLTYTLLSSDDSF